jgi:hypothetical protein
MPLFTPLFCKSKLQLMTAGMVHVTNLTPSGGANPSVGRDSLHEQNSDFKLQGGKSVELGLVPTLNPRSQAGMDTTFHHVNILHWSKHAFN